MGVVRYGTTSSPDNPNLHTDLLPPPVQVLCFPSAHDAASDRESLGVIRLLIPQIGSLGMFYGSIFGSIPDTPELTSRSVPTSYATSMLS